MAPVGSRQMPTGTSRVTRFRATSATTRAPQARAGPRAHGDRGPERRRQDQPSRGDLLRLPGALAAHVERARARPSRRLRTAWSLDNVGEDGATGSRSASSPGSRSGSGSTARCGRPVQLEERPLVSVFLPSGSSSSRAPPAAPRAHLDQLVAALWPARAGDGAAYSRALAQRNALLAASARLAALALGAWDAELARHGIAADGRPRRGGRRPAPAVRAHAPPTWACPARPRSATGRGRRRRRGGARGGARRAPRRRPRARLHHARAPPRRAAAAARRGRCARYGSQGSSARLCSRCCSPSASCSPSARRPPLMLLDDVMSELDATRGGLLASCCARRAGADHHHRPDHVPGARRGRARWSCSMTGRRRGAAAAA